MFDCVNELAAAAAAAVSDAAADANAVAIRGTLVGFVNDPMEIGQLSSCVSVCVKHEAVTRCHLKANMPIIAHSLSF